MKKPHTKVIHPLIIGFTSLFVLVVMIWGVNFFFSYKLYENLENNVISGKKMQLISNMIVTVRQRSKITNQMLITEDIFERDELLMTLDLQASTYTVQRATFLALPLTEDERNRSAQQDVLVRDIVPRLRHAAELAMTGEDEDFKESKRILYDDVMPRQEQLIINYMHILEEQKNHILNSSNNSIAESKNVYFVNFMIIFVVILMISLIARGTIKKITNIESELFNASEEKSNLITKLEEAQSQLLQSEKPASVG